MKIELTTPQFYRLLRRIAMEVALSIIDNGGIDDDGADAFQEYDPTKGEDIAFIDLELGDYQERVSQMLTKNGVRFEGQYMTIEEGSPLLKEEEPENYTK